MVVVKVGVEVEDGNKRGWREMRIRYTQHVISKAPTVPRYCRGKHRCWDRREHQVNS